MPTDPREIIVRRLFTLQALANTMGDVAHKTIREMFNEIAAEIVRLDPGSVQLRYRAGRLNMLEARVRELSGEAYTKMVADQRAGLARIGAEQAAQGTADLRAIIGAGSAGKLAPTTGLGLNFFKAVLDTEPLQGALLKDWFKAQSERTVFQVNRQIQLSMMEGEGVGDTVRRIRGRATGRRGEYTGGVMQTTTREATAIVRTAVNDISNTARLNTYQANADILAGYTIIATLDGRTSDICIAFAQQPDKVYPLDDGPVPPFHVNCRTTTAPAVDWAALGMEPPPDGTRASADGQVPSGTTYEQWLKGQPVSVQNDVLGPERAALFRDGRIGLDEMIKSDGRRVPLSELGIGGAEGGERAFREALAATEADIRTKAIEYAVVYDGDGVEIIRKTGTVDSVGFTREEGLLMRGGTFTHNHPSGRSFSPDDIRYAMSTGMAEMRAVGTIDGRAVSYVTRAADSSFDWSLKTHDTRIAHTLPAASNLAEKEVRAEWASGRMSREQANAEYFHRLWTHVSQGTGLHYERRFIP